MLQTKLVRKKSGEAVKSALRLSPPVLVLSQKLFISVMIWSKLDISSKEIALHLSVQSHRRPTSRNNIRRPFQLNLGFHLVGTRAGQEFTRQRIRSTP